MQEQIKKIMQESLEIKKEFTNQVENIEKAVEEIILCYKRNNKVLVCGNGGSAADAQHIAAEFVGKFEKERKSLPAIALNTNTSILTAISNDYKYEIIFERQIEALAKDGDVLIGLSTSGSSENVIRAFKKGKEIGTINISFTGRDGGKLKQISRININCSSDNAARIQECHILAYHIICKLVEEALFKK